MMTLRWAIVVCRLSLAWAAEFPAPLPLVTPADASPSKTNSCGGIKSEFAEEAFAASMGQTAVVSELSLLQSNARVAIRASAMQGSHQHRCFNQGLHEVHDQELVFCYAIVKPAQSRESTAALLGQQLSKACDGWSFFSTDEDDPASCIWRAFTETEMRHAIQYQMHEMVADGVLRWLEGRGMLDRYRWLVKVDPDSFVRPSMLRQGLARYPLDFDKVLSVSNTLVTSPMRNHVGDFEPVEPDEFLDGTDIDGYFVALPTTLVRRIRQVIANGLRDCDQVVSGHNNNPSGIIGTVACAEQAHFAGTEMFLDGAGDALVAVGSGANHTCLDISEELLRHKRDNPTWQERICIPGCVQGIQARVVCVSASFAVSHAVKSKEVYEEMAHNFP